MALDGAMISLLRQELWVRAEGARVDKIHMPSREEVVLLLRGPKGGERLLLSAKGSGARAGFTATAAENPKQPPMFCMLLRKHIGASRLVKIRQIGLERILFFDFSGYNELGDPTVLTLALEMMGRHSNIVLIGSDGHILDAARRIDASISSVRLVLPGLPYELPPPRGRFNLQTDRPEDIVTALQDQSADLTDALMALLQGVSPILAREIAFAAGGIDLPCRDLNPLQQARLTAKLAEVQRILRENTGTPVLLTDAEGKPRDMSFLPIGQYGDRLKSEFFPDYSSLLDRFYSARDTADRFKQRTGELHRLLTTRRDRVARRMAAQSAEVEESMGRDRLRQMGDILSANLYRVQPGMTHIRLENFYDPEGTLIDIALDPKLTPSQNAQRYYVAYRKADTTYKKLTELLREGELELDYLESALDNLSRADSEETYEAIRHELVENGIVRRRGKAQKPPKLRMRPLRYRSSDGFIILAGRNNLENEAITFKEADRSDLWLHAQRVPGAHTVVLAGGKPVPNRTIEEAAMIAACNSKLKNTGKAAVDYTLVRHVKKIPGAGPGMVIYNPYETAIVEADAAKIEVLLENPER
jgi:predicted ribosome quality control (RQC) complex YloA/Tae2 family protein